MSWGQKQDLGDHLVFWGSQQLRTGPSGFLLVSTGVHNSEAGLSIHLCVAALAGKQNLGEELGFGTVIEAEDRRAGWESQIQPYPQEASKIPEGSVEISFHPLGLCLNIASSRKWACVPDPSQTRRGCPITHWILVCSDTLQSPPLGCQVPEGVTVVAPEPGTQ